MSGFGGGGGGFGSTPQQQPPQFGGGGGFGSAAPAPAFGGGFGGAPAPASSGFGTVGASAPPSSSVPFGGSTAPAPATTFGSSANVVSAPGTSGFGQQQQPQQPQQSSGTFGTPSGFGGGATPSSLSSGFGASSSTANTPGFGSAPSNTTTTTTPTTTFGNSATAASSPFGGGGGAPAPATSFGAAPSAAAPPFGSTSAPSTTSFGAAAPVPFAPLGSDQGGGGGSTSQSTTTFGQSPNVAITSSFGQSSTSTAAPGPFGSTNAGSSSAMTFGSSSNVVSTDNNTQGGFSSSSTFGQSSGPFGSSSAGASAGQTTFGSAASTTAPSSGGFGASATTGSGFGASSSSTFGGSTTFGGGTGGAGTSDNNDMGSGGNTGNAKNNMTNSSPFGQSSSSASAFGQSTFGGTSNREWKASGRLSPVPEPGVSSTSPVPNSGAWSPTPPEGSAAIGSEDEKLAKLKAKIQAKKKKLEESKRRKEEAKAKASSNSGGNSRRSAPKPEAPASSGLNAEAPAFAPADDSITNKALAERNARRFATNKTKVSAVQLPSDLQGKTEKKKVEEEIVLSATLERQTDTLENAKALVGLCRHMCPDDELLRRERESDIQALEVPQPGLLHPENWTLRDTAVKRFRRSAADYKLNVPEWVRPPDVLERVCGYLEEWVMERDRQGPDARFPKSEFPPSLDVYQFVWDRTRMVRKDFILQNYVGTGGKCDARAVRCHERIARWHAMCEHQLSHISDFVTMQSQQNIQELGQTMKTLNQYYDDALGRSVVEIADEDGKEIASSISQGNHGCTSDIVMGKVPDGYNGAPLQNTADAAPTRLLGPHTVGSPARGTAEPEMRALYILLTMDNDGGMEVLKYASNIFQKRRDVYESRPVQLALQIFKAKKDYNYARYFSLLRSPSTPYLFACIMFKHVEQMRKVAIRIMSKTYGAKRKDTGESVYDVYPLKHLVRLLCFEDIEEARAACKHFDITVQTIENSSGKSVEVIFWRKSAFREPKDPEKGFALSLKPWKMVKTIESKLNGATRLAVCRGQVSGEGATLSKIPSESSALQAQLSPEEMEKRKREEEVARAAFAKAELEREQKRQEEEARMRIKAKAKAKAEAKAAEQARKKAMIEAEAKMKAAAKARAEEQARMEAEAKAKALAEAKAAEEARLKAEARAKAEAEARAVEEARRRAEAKAKAEAEARAAEKARLEAEARALAEAKARAEEEARLRAEEKARAEAEAKRREEEARRLRLLQIKRQKEEEERRKKEAERRRIALEWKKKIDGARKELIWRKWVYKLGRRRFRSESDHSFHQINPTLSSDSSVGFLVRDFVDDYDIEIPMYNEVQAGYYFNRLLAKDTEPFDHAKALEAVLNNGRQFNRRKEIILFKVAVIFPLGSPSCEAENLNELINRWIGSRLQYGKVLKQQRAGHAEVRSVAIRALNKDTCEACDVAIFVIPPQPTDTQGANIQFAAIDDSVPRLVLNLSNLSGWSYAQSMESVLSDILGDEHGGKGIISAEIDDNVEENLENALQSSCAALVKAFAHNCDDIVPRFELLPISELSLICVRNILWKSSFSHKKETEDDILNLARASLLSLVSELDNFWSQIIQNRLSDWPAREFLDESGVAVHSYFSRSEHLPKKWADALSRSSVEPVVMEMHASLTGAFSYVIENLSNRAPMDKKHEFDEMYETKQYRRCLESVLIWKAGKEKADPISANDRCIYLPRGKAQEIVEIVLRKLGLDDEPEDRLDVSAPTSSLRDWSRRQIEAAEDLALVSVPSSSGTGSGVEYVTVSEQSDTDGCGEDQFDNDDEDDDVEPLPVETPVRPAQTAALLKKAKFQLDEVDDDFLSTNKRALDTEEGFRRSSLPISKRQRNNVFASKDKKESQDFTKRLEEYVKGTTTVDIDIGKEKLSDLLRRDVPRIDSQFRSPA